MIVLQSTATGMAERPVVYQTSAAGMSSPRSEGELHSNLNRDAARYAYSSVAVREDRERVNSKVFKANQSSLEKKCGAISKSSPCEPFSHQPMLTYCNLCQPIITNFDPLNFFGGGMALVRLDKLPQFSKLC